MHEIRVRQDVQEAEQDAVLRTGEAVLQKPGERPYGR